MRLAKIAATKLYNDFVLRFGFPTRIDHDQGGEFENNLLKHLEELCGVQHTKTTSYHPEENGQAAPDIACHAQNPISRKSAELV